MTADFKSDSPQLSLARSWQSFNLGVVTVVGILVPGLWFWTTFVIYLAYLLGYDSFSAIEQFNETLERAFGQYLWTVIQFVMIYVVGIMLRTMTPDGPDRFGIAWSRMWDPGAVIASGDHYPYASLPDYLKSRGLTRLAELLPWHAQSERHLRSKTFVHGAKLFVSNLNPRLGSQLAQQEALVRMLSGVWHSVLLTTPVLIIAGLCRQQWNDLGGASSVILFVNLVVAVALMRAIHYQRLKEVVVLLFALWLACNPRSSHEDIYR